MPNTDAALPETRNRSEIPDVYKWDVSEIYPSWEAWEGDLSALQAKMDAFAGIKGTLGRDASSLLNAYRALDEIGMMQEKLYAYAFLSRDVDTRDQSVAKRMQQIEAVFAKFGTATAFFTPELLAIGWERISSWMDEEKGLEPYRFPISESYRRQAHVLDEKGEKLLSYNARFAQTPRSIYQELSTSDVVFPTITLSDGKEVTLTPGSYQAILATNHNQADRAKAFEAHLTTYAKMKNTYAAVYNSILQRNWGSAQARNYKNCLEGALDRNGIPTEVVEVLVEKTGKGTAPLQRYFQLRKRLLGLETYHLYDNSIPIYEVDKRYDYDTARRMVIESVAPLGEEYQKKTRELLNMRRTDVFENEGKRSGAYSAGVYGVGPYMLLNYNETLDAVFTFAHENGHSIHTLLSYETQPYAIADYTIFVAEVASTLNERLLLDYLLERTEDPKERFLLLQHAIDNIVGTFYTQVMFAAYELAAHKKAEQGEPITVDSLSDIYEGLLKEYYEDAITRDQLYRMTWARIPHFYNSPFYVYQYATCFASSAKIYNDLTTGSEADRAQARERYLTLLRSGGNDNPMEQLKKAGVDLGNPQTIQAVIDQMDDLVSRLEAEAAKIKQ